MIAVGLVLGELVSMQVMFRVTANMTADWGFGLVAIISAVLSFLLIFFITEPKLRKDGMQIAIETINKQQND